jgi:Fe-S cluster assembly protein SufD
VTIHSDPSTDARLGALARIEAIGYPTKRDEAWRYAPHRMLGELSFGPPPSRACRHRPTSTTGSLPSTARASWSSTAPSTHRCRTWPGPTVSVCRRWQGAIAERPEHVAAHFERADADIADAFVALDIAYGTDGAVIDVADGVTLDVPIHIVTSRSPTHPGTPRRTRRAPGS